MKIQFYKVPVPLDVGHLRKWSNVNPLIVNYHMVSNESLPHVNKLYPYRDISTFIKDIDYYSSNYHIIGLHDLLNSLKGDSVLPAKSLLITFDDGFREIYDHVAPILEERKISAVFFLTKQFIDNKELSIGCKKSLIINKLKSNSSSTDDQRVYELLSDNNIAGNSIFEKIMSLSYHQRPLIDEIASVIGFNFCDYLAETKPYVTSSQVVELINQGFYIGGHSVDHPRYHEITLEEQLYQTITSVDFLVEKFSIDYRVFAFPHTDRHITKEFFNAVSGTLDATFGLPGLIPDLIPFNFQRIGVENENNRVSRTIKFHYARRIIYQKLNRGYFKRD